MHTGTILASLMPSNVSPGDTVTDLSESRTFLVTGKPELINSGYISTRGILGGKGGERYFDILPTDDVKVAFQDEEETY